MSATEENGGKESGIARLVGIYRRSVWLLPKQVRDRDGEEIVATFEQLCNNAPNRRARWALLFQCLLE